MVDVNKHQRIESNVITGVIIAGGQGSRVGFQQKALLPYHGEPILKPILALLSSQVHTVWVNTNVEIERYQAFSEQLFADEYQGCLGPLAGMHAAGQYIQTDWAVLVPCDNPNLPNDFGSRTINAYQNQPNPIVVVNDGVRLQPLYMMMHRSMEEYLNQAIAKGHLSVNRWVKENDFTEACFADCCSKAFQNMNTLASFDVLEEPS